MALDKLLERKLISCSPDTTVTQVAELMDREDVGAIVVTENDEPVGIITDRDIVVRCVVLRAECAETPVRQIMTEHIVTVKSSDGIFDVIQAMKENRVRRVPVVDNGGKCIGLLSFGDIFQLLATEMAALSEPAAPETPKIVEKAA